MYLSFIIFFIYYSVKKLYFFSFQLSSFLRFISRVIQYLLFKPVSIDSSADAEELVQIYSLPEECKTHPVVYPALSMGLGGSPDGAIRGQSKGYMHKNRRFFGRRIDSRKATWKSLVELALHTEGEYIGSNSAASYFVHRHNS